MKTGWFFSNSHMLHMGLSTLLPCILMKMNWSVLGYIFHESPDCHMEIEFSSPSVGTALFTLKIMEDKEIKSFFFHFESLNREVR